MSFTPIIGHEKPISILKRALVNNTLAHAYIFSGPEAIGKKLTAFAVAAAVNCSAPGADGGCGECPSCRKMKAGGHPDVHIMASDGDDIKIDQIRQLQADLSLKPFEGVKKISVVDGAESMNPASANAFLKTLEEPPGEVLIILITSVPQNLLPTIRSRCQEIKFMPLSRQVLANALIEQRGFSAEDAWFAAALAGGSMGRGLEMDIAQERTAREEFAALWHGLREMSPADILSQADVLSKDRDRFEQLLAIGTELIRDSLILAETGDDRLLVHGQGKHLHQQWAARFPFQRMLADVELFSESRRLLERRVSAQLVAENLLLKLARA